MRRPRKLKQLLTIAITLLALILITLVALTIGGAGSSQLQDEIGNSLGLLADQMQDKLDRMLFERVRELKYSAHNLGLQEQAQKPQALAARLDELHAANPDYAWIAFSDVSGHVVRGTGGILQGVDVSREDWFVKGLHGATVGDVREFPSLASVLQTKIGAGYRFVPISAPVLDAHGQLVGVLAAFIDWHWAGEVRDSLFGASFADRSEDVLVLSAKGVGLLGPEDFLGKTLTLPSVQAAMTGSNRYSLERWPDGRTYVTGFARSDGYRDFAGLGWIVLVRMDAERALASVRRLQSQILIWSALISTVAVVTAWWIAGRLANPLLRLAESADNVRQGILSDIPYVRAYAEAETLSVSLSTLVSHLRQREAALKILNQSLEAQVGERTRELAARNEALTMARQQAEDATASKSRFLAAASHDLRQPLHAMSLFARALSRRVSGSEATVLVAQLEASLASLREMFEALLNVSRLDAGLLSPVISTVELGDLLGRSVSAFAAEAEARGLEFRFHEAKLWAATDPTLLETMVRNLVSNAIKFSLSGGVLLALRTVAARPAVEVWDTGPGIAGDRYDTVFVEFERSQAQAQGINEGLGLGLSIVRRYADLLGIEIRLASRVGRGTRFTLLLPKTPSGDQSAPARAMSDPSKSNLLQGLRVLVLDDDPSIVSALGRELEDRGCAPIPFTSLATATADHAAIAAADAAIVDNNLGNGATGLQFLATAESVRGTPLPALILTGATDADSVAVLLKAARPWLTKPADPEAIAAGLASLVTGRKTLSADCTIARETGSDGH